MTRDAGRGRAEPLGAAVRDGGVNFALYSEGAAGASVCLFDSPSASAPAAEIRLPSRTGHVRHGFVPGLRPGQVYGYRVEGPWAPERGLRFDPGKVLLDPYARAVARAARWCPDLYSYASDDPPDPAALERPASFSCSAASAPLGVVTRLEPRMDWDSTRPRTRWEDTLIYELHVRGYTKLHPEVPRGLRGTFGGLASEPVLDHLRRLGVTAVELLPVQHHADEHRLEKLGLTNFWGYQPLAWFAPEPAYASADGAGAVAEFRQMVRRFHAAGLEVILDVVYNHTCELGHDGPTLSLRGLDNATYYCLDPEDRRRYVDRTGCGNTLRTRHPAVVRLVLDSLRYWRGHMGVDGFRFDLAAALGRSAGRFDPWSALLVAIQQDPLLRGAKLIAEPWDLEPDDGSQLGRFPHQWSEWNGRFRDDVRRFWRGDAGFAPAVATRIAGSSDLFATPGRSPRASVNFVTAHDGFTLADLVSYSRKRNQPNGEGGRDGEDRNHSWSCGCEGPCSDPAVRALRGRQQRNLLATLLLSAGAPMLVAGDEFGRTQLGNNNAYCQDNEVSWVDWSLLEGSRLAGFVAGLAAVRRSQLRLGKQGFFDGLADPRTGAKDLAWIGPDGAELTASDWSDPGLACFGALYRTGRPGALLLLINASERERGFRLPGGRWSLLISTAAGRAGPRAGPGAAAVVRVEGRSLILLSASVRRGAGAEAECGGCRRAQ